MTSRWSFRDKKRYADWLSLASHEFFHTWNVRRLRPKTLVEYDYENEVYTESLWIAEGITSYYEDVALVRAGLIDQKDFLNRLTKNIESVHRSNGRKVQSLKESSFDTWIKFYRPDENSPNTRTSYYAKGAVVAFLLDAKIRSLTEGEKSLDEVMQTMFSKYAESGYLPADFRKVASEVAGEELDAWFKSAVDSTDELVFEDISALGVELAGMISKKSASDDKNTESEEAKDDGNVEGEVSDKDASDSVAKDAGESKSKKAKAKSVAKSKKPPAPKAWLGFRASESGGRMTISSVQSDSPATVAGLNTGDEVIALNDFRVTSSIDSRLRQYEIGDEVELLISRRGKLMKVLIEIGADPKRSWSLKLIAKPTDDQKAALKSWLGKPEISDE
jgi:predicted metalloprotease with PDZ domain